MANKLGGTNVTSPIRPCTDEDTYPSAYANEIKGGLHSYPLIADMYAIPKDRRELGMICIIAAGSIYMLINNPDTQSTTSDDWKLIFGNEQPGIATLFSAELMTKSSNSVENTTDNTKYINMIAYITNGQLSNLEVVCPFEARLDKISSAVPIDSEMNRDVEVQVQIYNQITWDTIASVSIGSGTKEGAFTPLQETIIPAGSRLRMVLTAPLVDSTIVSISSVLSLTKLS
jgi:hypothetical protein